MPSFIPPNDHEHSAATSLRLSRAIHGARVAFSRAGRFASPEPISPCLEPFYSVAHNAFRRFLSATSIPAYMPAPQVLSARHWRTILILLVLLGWQAMTVPFAAAQNSTDSTINQSVWQMLYGVTNAPGIPAWLAADD